MSRFPITTVTTTIGSTIGGILTARRRCEPTGRAGRPGLLHAIFEAQADARPRATAIHASDRITYGRLEQRANRLARWLRANGVARGDTVAMNLPPSVDAYAAILGILKAGAAYVPIDPEVPADRAGYIAADSSCRALVTNAALASRVEGFRGTVILVDRDAAAIDAQSPARLPHEQVGVAAADLCYIIYTSGSTGRPKGVMIEHHGAAHLVCTERRIYGVRPSDRVYQGASLSFDLSVEELWLALASGAALVPVTPELAHAGRDLSRLLAERGVTVLSCVPTLLALLEEDVPTIRLLILGGEACPAELVQRWANRRRLINTYGPTETTVIATYKDLHPDEPVSIGWAIPGYSVRLLDEELRPVAAGQVGEICIGGEGVARGYVGLPTLTAERFVADPFAAPGERAARLYRSGDLGRVDEQGRLVFCGRRDGQVKLRGFRIELAEIEAAMMQDECVRAAACAVHDAGADPRLVGYVVPREGSRVDTARLRSTMRGRLPGYMVPAVFETIAALPLLPSGKLDRAALPAPRSTGAPSASGRGPRTVTERTPCRIWGRISSLPSVSIDDDFFLDLGGHSLAAARMVSEARRDPRLARVSVPDVYRHATIAKLAAAIDATGDATRQAVPRKVAAQPRGRSVKERVRALTCGALQALGMYLVFAAHAMEWVTPYLVFLLVSEAGTAPLAAAAWAAVSAVAVFPAMLLLALAAKWLLLGRLKPGRHRLWGGWYVRWWLVQALVEAVPLKRLSGTPLLPMVYRLFGARIGRDVHMETDKLAAWDLLSIGSGSSIDEDAVLVGSTVENGEIVIEPIRVGRRCYVGARSVLCGGASMDDGARLEDLAMLPRDVSVPRGQTWAGSPARPSSEPPKKLPAPPRSSRAGPAIVAMYCALASAIPLLMLVPLVPGVALLLRVGVVERPLVYLAAVPLVGASFVVLLAGEIVVMKWLLLGRVRPGCYPVHRGFYVRNWIVERMRSLSLDLAGQLHATVYLAPWYRALGARLGKFVELSTASSTSPDLLEIAEGGTVADEVSLGVPTVERGWMTVAPTKLGRRAFIGNSAVIPAGTTIGEGTLIGVMSVPPARGSEQGGATWLGSPPLALPRRQASAAFPEARTYRPTRWLYLTRAAIELLRVTLPPAGFIVVSAVVLTAATAVASALGLAAMLALLPLFYAAACAAVLLLVVAAKWCIVGRFKPFAHPLWSTSVWRLELVNALYEFLATPLALEVLQGTPFLPLYLRLLGARIGRGVYLQTTGFLEFDLTEVGDRCAVNDACILQTHLFEDRVLKASWLRIGPDTTLGACAVVLYDTVLEGNLRVEALSLVMKGEALPSGTAWAGIPAAWAGSPVQDDRHMTA